jgi:hypothetical protein
MQLPPDVPPRLILDADINLMQLKSLKADRGVGSRSSQIPVTRYALGPDRVSLFCRRRIRLIERPFRRLKFENLIRKRKRRSCCR